MESPAILNFLREAHHLDQRVTLALNALNSPPTDYIWQIFSDTKIWFALYAAVLFFLFRQLGWKKALVVTLSCVITVIACDQLANLAKASFERLRPCWDGNMVQAGLYLLEEKGGRYGFYSGHAANAMGFAMCSWMGLRNDGTKRYRGYAWFIFLWAFLVGLSRVFVGKHFLGDVLTGFAAGLLTGWLFAALARLLIRHIGTRPSAH